MKTSSAARRATVVTTAFSFSLVILKTIVGLASGSVAVLASAVDSLLDFMVSLFNAFAVRGSEKPRDENHNYGHGKIEGVAALFEGLFILASAIFVLWKAGQKFLHPTALESTGLNLEVDDATNRAVIGLTDFRLFQQALDDAYGPGHRFRVC
jgi:cation diffusion facilitator family transporter